MVSTMKIGRNDPCPCGSGKKYKRCCINMATETSQQIGDELKQMLAMNPDLSIEDLNVAMGKKVAQKNDLPLDDFCGLSPSQLNNWMYQPLEKLQGVKIHVPNDIHKSPVMRYLALIIDSIIEQGGVLKATAKGNLPAKLVKQASSLQSEFAVNKYRKHDSISEFAGANEDKMNALHYARVLAELCNIIRLKNGKFMLTADAEAKYQQHGIGAFFKPMLETAAQGYNWGYFDAHPSDAPLNNFWLFMLWRIQTHGSILKLGDEMDIAFPALTQQMPKGEHLDKVGHLKLLIETRFIHRFLIFWGFAIINPRCYYDGKFVEQPVEIQSLLKQTFEFLV